MNIYYVSIHTNTNGTIHDIYYGIADTAMEAIEKAVDLAKSEGVENPIVHSCILEGKKAF